MSCHLMNKDFSTFQFEKFPVQISKSLYDTIRNGSNIL